jgi:hypothetical protein
MTSGLCGVLCRILVRLWDVGYEGAVLLVIVDLFWMVESFRVYEVSEFMVVIHNVRAQWWLVSDLGWTLDPGIGPDHNFSCCCMSLLLCWMALGVIPPCPLLLLLSGFGRLTLKCGPFILFRLLIIFR